MGIEPELAAVCGNFCGPCDFLGRTCAGCLAQKGRMFWGTCERYQCCVEEKHLNIVVGVRSSLATGSIGIQRSWMR